MMGRADLEETNKPPQQPDTTDEEISEQGGIL
jgi:hypothetical protein